jgi:hypothetical protein
MPCTVKDDKSAIAQTSGVELQRHKARFENLAGFAANSNQPQASTPKLVISNWTGGLAVLLLICLAARVDAGLANLNCSPSTYVKCRDAARFLDIDGFVNILYSGSPKQFITGRNNSYGRYNHRKTGDYLDKEWYQYLDEGQYYYLDRTQYKLLGGASYILGHPCYPKLYERRSGHTAGFTNRRRIHIPWYDCYWDYLSSSACTGYNGIPIDNYVVWHSYLKPGDNIEKLRYRYLDKWRYYILDVTQYKWLGGLAYEFETIHSRNWYMYDSLYCYNFYGLLKKINKESMSTPEPATIAFMGLGVLGLLILRNKKGSA